MPQKVLERQVNMPVPALQKMVTSELKEIRKTAASNPDYMAFAYRWNKKKNVLSISLKDHPVTARLELLPGKAVITVDVPGLLWPLVQLRLRAFETKLDEALATRGW